MKNKKVRVGIIAILAVILVITGVTIISRMRHDSGERRDSRVFRKEE